MKEFQRKLIHTSYFINHNCRQARTFFFFSILIFAGCRSVIPVRDIRSSSAPDISRLVLKKGDSVVVFNKDFGWYNKQAEIVEGVTADSQHVSYPVASISKVETVRDYSLVAAVYVGGVIIGAAIYLISKLLTLVP